MTAPCDYAAFSIRSATGNTPWPSVYPGWKAKARPNQAPRMKGPARTGKSLPAPRAGDIPATGLRMRPGSLLGETRPSASPVAQRCQARAGQRTWREPTAQDASKSAGGFPREKNRTVRRQVISVSNAVSPVGSGVATITGQSSTLPTCNKNRLPTGPKNLSAFRCLNGFAYENEDSNSSSKVF